MKNVFAFLCLATCFFASCKNTANDDYQDNPNSKTIGMVLASSHVCNVDDGHRFSFDRTFEFLPNRYVQTIKYKDFFPSDDCHCEWCEQRRANPDYYPPLIGDPKTNPDGTPRYEYNPKKITFSTTDVQHVKKDGVDAVLINGNLCKVGYVSGETTKFDYLDAIDAKTGELRQTPILVTGEVVFGQNSAGGKYANYFMSCQDSPLIGIKLATKNGQEKFFIGDKADEKHKIYYKTSFEFDKGKYTQTIEYTRCEVDETCTCAYCQSGGTEEPPAIVGKKCEFAVENVKYGKCIRNGVDVNTIWLSFNSKTDSGNDTESTCLCHVNYEENGEVKFDYLDGIDIRATEPDKQFKPLPELVEGELIANYE